jgi:excisionase family DNA binding protein
MSFVSGSAQIAVLGLRQHEGMFLCAAWSFEMDRQFNFEECNFSVTEAAQYLRVSRGYMYKLFATGSLRPTKLGARTIVQGSEMKRFMAEAAAGQ